jgi:hypothetical protein
VGRKPNYFEPLETGRDIGGYRVIGLLKVDGRRTRYRVQCLKCGRPFVCSHYHLHRRERTEDAYLHCIGCRPNRPRRKTGRAAKDFPPGTTHTMNGLYYKRNIRGKLLRWNGDDWVIANPDRPDQLREVA